MHCLSALRRNYPMQNHISTDTPDNDAKTQVGDFWNMASCGETLYLAGYTKEDYKQHSAIRYELEPHILDHAEFSRFNNKRTLEIGVGLGADHQMLAEAGAELSGIDLTDKAVEHTKHRFQMNGLVSDIQQGDCEQLDFADESFDAVYSWGVLHHSPDTPKAIQEVRRILKPGGFAKIMIYNKYSMIGYMLWLRYGLLTLKPWTSLDTLYSKYLESPGTKAYSRSELAELFSGLHINYVKSPLCHGDLLTSKAGQRHEGPLLNIARALLPRFLIKKLLPSHGLHMMIDVTKRDV